MTFNLALLATIVIGYLVVLFLAAYVVEQGWISKRHVSKPLIYTLSLGVYASAWAFYGSVGLAHQYGISFLAYYLGISAAFLAAPILLKPALHITRTYQLTSLADVFAFRYRSRSAGMLVTGLMLIISVLILSLQIAAMAGTMHIINPEIPARGLAFAFCVIMILFAVLFGARHVSNRIKHEGLIFALAFESLLKLAVLLILAGVCVWQLFFSQASTTPWFSEQWPLLIKHPNAMPLGAWVMLLLMFFSAAITMPHMFHVTFTENITPRSMNAARWGMPLFLAAMALAITPILWAGNVLHVGTSTEYFSLGIGLAINSSTLTMLTFVGGLAAASGIIIVTTLAMSAMLLNHWVLPFYTPNPGYDFYRWLLWVRRALIAAILLLAYLFYMWVAADLNLTELGLMAFMGSVQFLPGVIGLLYWPRANHRGLLLGIILGVLVWVYALILPMLEIRLNLSIPLPLPPVNVNNWHLPALASFGINLLAFVALSLLTTRKTSEVSAAEACSVDTFSKPSRRPLQAADSNDIIIALSKPLGHYVAEREVFQALEDLELPSYEDRPFALRRLRDKLEANLSGLMGPTVAHDIISRCLPFNPDQELSEDIHQIEQRLDGFHERLGGLAGELDDLRRYHKQTLENLPMGVCSLSDDNEVLMWNHAMFELTEINAAHVTGSYLNRLPDPWGTMLLEFANGMLVHEHSKKIVINQQPRWFGLHKSIIQNAGSKPNGIVILIVDQTQTQLLQDRLTHNERLASIGRLAAGVAHEIGNPITGIDCLAQSVRYETDNPNLLTLATQIQELTQRVNRIMQSLTSFAHTNASADDFTEVNVFNCVKEAIDLLTLNQRSRDIDIINRCPNDLYVQGDTQRLMQVFINLLSNACDASQPDQHVLITAKRDDYSTIIDVTDQGQGIPDNVIEQVFDPFFTTKDVGRGTGLGLSLVYSIIEEHSGMIHIDSPVQDGHGTRFTITLPNASRTQLATRDDTP